MARTWFAWGPLNALEFLVCLPELRLSAVNVSWGYKRCEGGHFTVQCRNEIVLSGDDDTVSLFCRQVAKIPRFPARVFLAGWTGYWCPLNSLLLASSGGSLNAPSSRGKCVSPNPQVRGSTRGAVKQKMPDLDGVCAKVQTPRSGSWRAVLSKRKNQILTWIWAGGRSRCTSRSPVRSLSLLESRNPQVCIRG